MTNEQQTNAATISINTPVAIIIAGALIAIAIYAGGGISLNNSGSGSAMGGSQPAAGTNPAAQQGAAAGTPAPTVGDIREVDETDHVRGSENAKITLIEYSDYECPFCKRFHPTVEQVLEEYPNDVRWVYRHFPLEAIHPQARLTANAAECAGAQGKFWEFTDYVFENTSSGADLTEDKLNGYARTVGVPNMATFSSCLSERQFDDKVSADIADAAAAGGRGTPHTILIGPDGQKVPLSGAQPFASIKTQIDSLLNG